MPWQLQNARQRLDVEWHRHDEHLQNWSCLDLSSIPDGTLHIARRSNPACDCRYSMLLSEPLDDSLGRTKDSYDGNLWIAATHQRVEYTLFCVSWDLLLDASPRSDSNLICPPSLHSSMAAKVHYAFPDSLINSSNEPSPNSKPKARQKRNALVAPSKRRCVSTACIACRRRKSKASFSVHSSDGKSLK